MGFAALYLWFFSFVLEFVPWACSLPVFEGCLCLGRSSICVLLLGSLPFSLESDSKLVLIFCFFFCSGGARIHRLNDLFFTLLTTELGKDPPFPKEHRGAPPPQTLFFQCQVFLKPFERPPRPKTALETRTQNFDF